MSPSTRYLRGAAEGEGQGSAVRTGPLVLMGQQRQHAALHIRVRTPGLWSGLTGVRKSAPHPLPELRAWRAGPRSLGGAQRRAGTEALHVEGTEADHPGDTDGFCNVSLVTRAMCLFPRKDEGDWGRDCDRGPFRSDSHAKPLDQQNKNQSNKTALVG